MKQNYILFLLFTCITLSVRSQVVLIDQPVDGLNGIVSGFMNDVSLGTYSADDFTLADDYIIDTIITEGFVGGGIDVTTVITGLDVYIYSDASGSPSSNPTLPGTGLLEIVNLSPTSPALTIVDSGFTIDVAAALGSELELAAGTYWLVVSASVPTLAQRWNWFQTTVGGGNAKIFDEGNFGGAIDWTLLGDLGIAFDALNMNIEGTLSSLSLDEYTLDSVSLFPNPAKDMITLDLPDSVGDFKTEIYSVIGQLVAKSSNRKQFDVSNLNSGIYLIRIFTDNGSVTKRFTKN